MIHISRIVFLILSLAGNYVNAQQAKLYYDSAVNRFKNKDYFGTLILLNKAIKINPIYIDAYINRAETELQLKDYPGAEEDYNKVLLLDTSNVPVFLNRASVRVARENWQGALNDYDKAIQALPSTPEIYNVRGLVKLELADSAGALMDFDKSVEIDSGFLAGYISRSYLNDALKKYDEVLKDCIKMLQISPGNTDVLITYGIAKYNLHDLRGAIDEYNKVIVLDADNAIAWYNRGFTELKLKDKKNACRDLLKADALGFKDAKELIKNNCK